MPVSATPACVIEAKIVREMSYKISLSNDNDVGTSLDLTSLVWGHVRRRQNSRVPGDKRDAVDIL